MSLCLGCTARLRQDELVLAALQDFAAAAWGSSPDVVDGWISAPGGTRFLGLSDLGDTMYVREAYVALYKALEAYKKKGKAHVVISGNPGMGKSWSTLYMLIRYTLPRMSSHRAQNTSSLKLWGACLEGSIALTWSGADQQASLRDLNNLDYLFVPEKIHGVCVHAGGWGTRSLSCGIGDIPSTCSKRVVCMMYLQSRPRR